MQPLDDGGEVRAGEGWLAVALVGAVLPWQTMMSTAACGAGGVCGWVSGPNSVYTSALSAGPKSLAFWGWVVYLSVAVVGFAAYELSRHFPNTRRAALTHIGDGFYRRVGVVLLLSALLAASSTSSTISSVDSRSAVARAGLAIGPSIWIWVVLIPAVALCRGGHLFKALNRPSHFLKQLLFEPDTP